VLKRQDNDLIEIQDAQAAAKFKHAFEARFASGKLWRNLSLHYTFAFKFLIACLYPSRT
jgi:hypothetical protein